MFKKTIFYLLCFAFCINTIYSQDNYCGTVENPPQNVTNSKNTSNTYLSISNSTGLNIHNYLLTENSTCREINTTALTTGIYIVSLVHDGNIIDSKQLIKN